MQPGSPEYEALEAEIDRKLTTYRHRAESEPEEERRFIVVSEGVGVTSYFNTLGECLNQYLHLGKVTITDTISGEAISFDEDGELTPRAGTGYALWMMLSNDPGGLADWRNDRSFSTHMGDYGLREQKYRNALVEILHSVGSGRTCRAIAASCLLHWDKN